MVLPNYNQRSSAIAGPPTRQLHVRATSLNDAARSFEAVVASKKPVAVIDFRSGGIVDEILLASGGQFPDSVPLLDSHQRNSTVDVIGSMFQFRREGTQWVGSGRVATDDPHADTVWAKMRDGHLNSFSIGYRILEFTDVHPGRSETIDGRIFKNDSDRTLRVVTQWQVSEVSIVAIPADSTAKLRSASAPTQSRSNNQMPALPTPAIHSRDSITGRPSIGAIQSALLMKSGINDPTQHRVSLHHNSLMRLAPCLQFEEDADRGRGWADNHIIDLMRYAMEADGIRFSDNCTHQEVLYKSSEYHFRAGVSTGNLAQMFTQTFGALFLQGYDSEGDSTAGWTSENDNLNLRVTPRVRPSTMSPLKKRGAGQTAEGVSFEAVGEKTQLGEYSGEFTIDEQDLVNNQFGNFDEVTPQQMGAAAKRLRPDLVFATLLANPVMRDGTTLFHADHQNLQTAASLGETTLEDSQALMGSQTEGGVALNLYGRYIVVPQKLSRMAAKLAKGVDLNDSESTSPPVVRFDARLNNGVVDPATGTVLAGSDTTWFLSAAGHNHTIEVQYLKGTGRQPQIRSGFLSQGSFGVWFDVQHYIGSKAIDWRGLVKSIA